MALKVTLPVSERPIAPDQANTELWINREAVPLFKSLRDVTNGNATDLETAETDIAAVEADVAALEATVAGLTSNISIRGSFRHQDQTGAHVAASTRTHWWGMHCSGGVTGTAAGTWMASQTSAIIQAAAGGMAYAYPDVFERDVTINRLITRTNGRAGVAGGNVRLAVYNNTVLTSGAFTGDDYPGTLLGQSLVLPYPGGANALMETAGLTIPISQGEKYWGVWVQDTAGVAGAYSIVAYPAGGLFPFLGFTMDATTPTTISGDNATAGVCWRHSITFTGTESFPSTFPQTSIVVGVSGQTPTHPAVGFGMRFA